MVTKKKGRVIKKKGRVINPQVAALAKANLVGLLKAVKIGFELETQKYEGKTKQQLDDIVINRGDKKSPIYVVDDEKVKALKVARGMEKLDKHGIAYLAEIYDSIRKFNRVIPNSDLLKTKDINSVLTAFGYDPSKFAAKLTAHNAVTDDELKKASKEIFYPQFPGVVSAADGTVTGFEFRSEGNGVTAQEFRKLTKAVFNGAHKIDTGCSFHIHLSLDGIKHRYGKNFQAFATDYILRHWSFLPESVQRRISNYDYYRPRISTDKYTAVAYHQRYYTWEFRIFGNVQNAKEASICLIMALRAMQYAYQSIIARKVAPTNEQLTYFAQGLQLEVSNYFEQRGTYKSTKTQHSFAYYAKQYMQSYLGAMTPAQVEDNNQLANG